MQGRPMRVKKTALVMDWEENRQPELRSLLSQGIIPIGFSGEVEDLTNSYPLIMGAVRLVPSAIDNFGELETDWTGR